MEAVAAAAAGGRPLLPTPGAQNAQSSAAAFNVAIAGGGLQQTPGTSMSMAITQSTGPPGLPVARPQVPGLPGLPGIAIPLGRCHKIEDRRPKTAIPHGRSRESGRSCAAKRPFRVGGVAKVGDPTPQNGHSAWEGPQNLNTGNLPIVRLWRLLPCKMFT